jgi:hypothetical protein
VLDGRSENVDTQVMMTSPVEAATC